MRIDPVRHVLDGLGVSYALIGAHAMAARGYPRLTVDVDLLTTDARVLEPSMWSDIERQGGTVDARRGDADDPLGGVVHVLLADGSDIDVVVGKWEWEARIIDRAEVMSVAGAEIRVPRTADLILMKLAAGGYLDLRDAAALLALGDREDVVREVEAHIDEVRPGVLAAWRELLSSVDR